VDYSRYLVLYSGGADSTYFLLEEPSALHLLHYRGFNDLRTKFAIANAYHLGRRMSIANFPVVPTDGEINSFHALVDTEMALNACITALSFGMQGIVLCFNKDDLGINVDALTAIMRAVNPDFEVLTPLRDTSAAEIREKVSGAGIPYVSCMVDRHCGECPKCRRGY
jgi:7-cyano-7-deazaguanine synthase in queuosine biosynthesis